MTGERTTPRRQGHVISINQVDQGDTIILPQPPETYSDNRPGTYQPGERLRITRAWWHSATSRHMIQLDSEHHDAIIAFDSTELVTLIDRPGFGPFDVIYQVGQKVHVKWMGQTMAGVVVKALHLPDDSVYVVRTGRRTSAYVGVETMRTDHSPLPAEGQQWVCLRGQHQGLTLTVISVDGLEATCLNSCTGNPDHYILTSANYGLTVDTAPEPTGVRGVDYEDIEMDVSGVTKMVRVFR